MTRPFEIEDGEQLAAHLATGQSLRGAFVQAVDLGPHDTALRAASVQGAVFLGCVASPALDASLRARGALVFPSLPDVPVNPYRATLYRAEELYDTLPVGTYSDSLDARVYAWAKADGHPPTLAYSLAAALHDHAISDALEELTAGVETATIVGLMGGHAAERGTDAYAASARLARDLTRAGRTVLSGGGPGAMEAANLGAWFAGHDDADLDEALALLATVPSFKPSIDAWARTAFDVRRRWPAAGTSIGVPTWFYGHEPPNAFATHVAKYFSNAQREDVLLTLCHGGLVYLPGAAGTVQELFQAVTPNYYAAAPELLTPLVLVGREQWTEKLPAWPLLQALAAGRAMADRVALVDDVREVPAALGL